jgi:hypothetical protein
MGILVTNTETPVVVKHATIPKWQLASSVTGSVKVRLSYLTHEPKHIRSITLRDVCGIKPPYLEDVYVLLPREKVFSMLETFLSPFESLQQSGAISKTAQLQDYKILDEDNLTLAYIF